MLALGDKPLADDTYAIEVCGLEDVMTEAANLIPSSIADNLPAMVRNELVKLTPQRQEEFVEEYRRKAKSTGAAYLLWLLLGWHYAYLRTWGIQILFWVTLGGLFVWWFIDLFRIPGMIRDYNKDVSVDVLRNLKVLAG